MVHSAEYMFQFRDYMFHSAEYVVHSEKYRPIAWLLGFILKNIDMFHTER